MRTLLLFLILCAASNSWAITRELLSARQPTIVKAPGNYIAPISSTSPLEGDTIDTAFLIATLPFHDIGTTIGYQDDYEFSCPYTSPAPDVIYRYEPDHDQWITIDLCGSQYDTQVFVFDSEYNEIACNEIFYSYPEPCGIYVSRINFCPVSSGETYFIAVDGYIHSAGEYELNIWEEGICEVACPSGIIEGEPALHDGYTDNFNGGCNSDGTPLNNLDANQLGEITVCGTSGWYEVSGDNWRDTDWFEVVAGATGDIDISITSEYSTRIYVLAPPDCSSTEIIGFEQLPSCGESQMTVTGDPGETYWVVVVPLGFVAPVSLEGHEFDYVLQMEGLQQGPVATEKITMGTLKASYR